MAIALGDSIPSTFKLGDAQVNALALGDSVFWTSFAPSGMNKTGTTTTIGTSYAEVASWAADTAGYPGSTISGNALVVNGGSSNATVAGLLKVTNSSFSQSVTVTLRLYKNGSLLATGSPVTIGANNSAGVDVTINSTGNNLANGDLITVQAISTATGTGARTILSGWCRVTQP